MIPLCVGIVLGLVGFMLLRADWTPGRYKVMYRSGPTVNLATRMDTGSLALEGGRLWINGRNSLSLPLQSVRSVEVYRLHGVGRMIRLIHDGGTLHVSVVRFCIAGQLAMVDFFKTGALADLLRSASLTPPPT